MFAALGRFVTRFPWYVIGAWVLLAVAVVSLAPALTSTQDESEFLPKHYESIRAAQVQEDEFPSQSQPGAIMVFDRTDGGKLTAADSAKVAEVVQQLDTAIKEKSVYRTVFSTAAAQPPSQNGLVELGVVGLAKDATGFDTPAMDAAKQLRKDAKPLVADTGLRVQMTGSAPQQLDSQESGDKTLAIVGLATIVLIILLLALIFRSVIICLMPVFADRLGQRHLRPQGRLLDRGHPDRRALRHRDRLHPLLPLPLSRAAARRWRHQGGGGARPRARG
jgi:putative drug exporter of the RND superfamily